MIQTTILLRLTNWSNEISLDLKSLPASSVAKIIQLAVQLPNGPSKKEPMIKPGIQHVFATNVSNINSTFALLSLFDEVGERTKVPPKLRLRVAFGAPH